MRPYSTKLLSFLISILILLQGCVVYKKSPTSLREVSREKIRAKVIMADGKPYKFKYITAQNEQFYGVNQVSGKLVRIDIKDEEVVAVYAKNKTASTLLTLSPFILITGLYVVIAASGGPSLGSIGW